MRMDHQAWLRVCLCAISVATLAPSASRAAPATDDCPDSVAIATQSLLAVTPIDEAEQAASAGHVGDGISILTAAIAKTPCVGALYEARAEVWLKARKFGFALDDEEQASRVEGLRSFDYGRRAVIYAQRGIADADPGDLDAAIADYGRAIASAKERRAAIDRPDNPANLDMDAAPGADAAATSAALSRAKLFLITGRIDKALADLDLVAASPNQLAWEAHTQALTLRAGIALRSHQVAKALDDCNLALSKAFPDGLKIADVPHLDPGDAAIVEAALRMRGDVWTAQGKAAKAKADYDQARRFEGM